MGLVAVGLGVWAVFVQDGSASSGARPMAGADRAMARDVDTYVRRNAVVLPWYPELESITAAEGVVT